MNTYGLIKIVHLTPWAINYIIQKRSHDKLTAKSNENNLFLMSNLIYDRNIKENDNFYLEIIQKTNTLKKIRIYETN